MAWCCTVLYRFIICRNELMFCRKGPWTTWAAV